MRVGDSDMFRDSTGEMDSETPENGSLRLCTLGESVKIGGIEPEGYLAHVTPTPNGNRNKGIPISKPAGLPVGVYPAPRLITGVES